MFRFLFVVLFIVVGGQAQMSECLNSCSSRCTQYAEDLIQSGRDILARCGSSGGKIDGEIINRCNWHFSGDLAVRCASRANSVVVIDRCQWHFGSNQKGLNCVSARSVEIVDRCNWHFGNTDNGSLCAGKARSREFVEQCVWNFGSNERGLSCITGD